MKNKGINTNRLRSNPAEKIFATNWEELNTDVYGKLGREGILDFILAKEANNPKGEVSNRDREVAASVVQWMGSPVGLMFLKQVQNEIEEGELI